MDAKEKQMVSLGARLIESGSAAKTATQDQNDAAAEHSVLSLIVSNISEAYTQCLAWMARFANITGETVYKINQDFTRASLDATILRGLFDAVQGGKLPEADFWQYLRDRGVINPEKTDDEIRDELETANGGPDLDDEEEVGTGGRQPSDT
jgi:predicted Rdx family selenoprotein